MGEAWRSHDRAEMDASPDAPLPPMPDLGVTSRDRLWKAVRTLRGGQVAWTHGGALGMLKFGAQFDYDQSIYRCVVVDLQRRRRATVSATSQEVARTGSSISSPARTTTTFLMAGVYDRLAGAFLTSGQTSPLRKPLKASTA